MIKCIIFLRQCISSTLVPLAAVILAIVIPFTACSINDQVKEYFQSHGLSYPSDISGVSLWNIKYSGVGEDELLAPGSRDFIQEGLMSIKEHFHKKDFDTYTQYIDAIIVTDPVLFRGESGDVGLMVKVTAYGSGPLDRNVKLSIKRIGKNNKIWKAENFAYFNRRGLDKWQHAGWVY
jgi:hypothetical protein